MRKVSNESGTLLNTIKELRASGGSGGVSLASGRPLSATQPISCAGSRTGGGGEVIETAAYKKLKISQRKLTQTVERMVPLHPKPQTLNFKP